MKTRIQDVHSIYVVLHSSCTVYADSHTGSNKHVAESDKCSIMVPEGDKLELWKNVLLIVNKEAARETNDLPVLLLCVVYT